MQDATQSTYPSPAYTNADAGAERLRVNLRAQSKSISPLTVHPPGRVRRSGSSIEDQLSIEESLNPVRAMLLNGLFA